MTQLKNIKSKLHGAQRIVMQTEMNSTVRKIVEMRQANEMGKIIEVLSCQPRDQVDLQTLPCNLKGQIVDHKEIQEKLKEYFTDWYASPKHLDPAAKKMDKCDEWWSTLLDFDHSVDSPQQLHPDSRIPPELQDGLRRVCAKKVTGQTSDRIEEAIYRDVKYEDISEAINDITNDGAAAVR